MVTPISAKNLFQTIFEQSSLGLVVVDEGGDLASGLDDLSCPIGLANVLQQQIAHVRQAVDPVDALVPAIRPR